MVEFFKLENLFILVAAKLSIFPLELFLFIRWEAELVGLKFVVVMSIRDAVKSDGLVGFEIGAFDVVEVDVDVDEDDVDDDKYERGIDVNAMDDMLSSLDICSDEPLPDEISSWVS